mgnify:CR=1 FL=1
MFFLLFGFWVLLNGSWTLEIALIGLVVSAALYAFIVKFMGYSPKKDCAPSAAHHRVLSVSGEGGFPLGVGDDQTRLVAEARC